MKEVALGSESSQRKGCGNDGQRGMSGSWLTSLCPGNAHKLIVLETACPNSCSCPAERLVLGSVVFLRVFQVALAAFLSVIAGPYAWFLVLLPYPKYLHPSTVPSFHSSFTINLLFPALLRELFTATTLQVLPAIFFNVSSLCMFLVCVSCPVPCQVLHGTPCRAVACLPGP